MEPPSTSSNVTVLNRTGRPLRRGIVRQAVEKTLEIHRSEGPVEVLLERDEVVRDLNRTYRRVDESTDVLSFPGGGFPHAPLGEVAISVPYAAKQAAIRNARLHDELALLAIHGTLHLLGMDDQDDDDRAAMVEEMNRIARLAGVEPDEDWHSRLKEQR